MKSNNFILFSEIWIFCCYYHPVSCSGTSLGWRGYTGFTGFVLDLKRVVIDVTRASQLQLHLTEYKSNQSLESSVCSTEWYSRPSRWTNNCSRSPADTKRKAQMQNLSDPRLRDSRFFYTLSGLLCRAKVLRMKYQKKEKTPRQIWKTSWLLDPRIRWIRTSPGALSGSSLPKLKDKIYRNTTAT